MQTLTLNTLMCGSYRRKVWREAQQAKVAAGKQAKTHLLPQMYMARWGGAVKATTTLLEQLDVIKALELSAGPYKAKKDTVIVLRAPHCCP